eukprot:12893067-Prorocentrum_lima.AAC.1
MGVALCDWLDRFGRSLVPQSKKHFGGFLPGFAGAPVLPSSLPDPSGAAAAHGAFPVYGVGGDLALRE